jgi:4-hydroxybenzoate polyprenyltransferase
MASSLLQKAAMVVAAVFLLVGVLGFVPGVTSDYDSMEFAGHESGAQLLGIFGVSVLHNLVHVLFGVAGFALARSWEGARAFLLGGGVIYLVLVVYGLLVDRHDEANFVPLDAADNWLHLVLGLGMLGLGLALGRSRTEGGAV